MSHRENTKAEKRRFPRVKKLYLLSYVNRLEGRQTSPVSIGRTLDISPAGIRIEVFQDIEIDSEMEMEIGLKKFDSTIRGKVMRVQKIAEKDYIIGIRFDQEQPDLSDEIKIQGQWDHVDL